MKWNYTSILERSSGYEDVLDQLKTFTPEKFLSLTDKDKEKMINNVFNIYRSKNIFPITYYNNDGIKKEIIKCLEKEVSFNSNTLDFKFLQGINLCRFLFPNLSCVRIKNDKNNSEYDRFYNDKKLKTTIKFLLRYEKPLPIGILRAQRLIGGGIASNFSPMRAKAIYEKYCPKNGIIYDFSCGFGGRMLGALSSKNNYKYFGTEPGIETFDNLNKLGTYIETVTNRKKIFKIYKTGSENYFAKENYIDFAFSSPPYFNLEKYSDEESQCYNKYPEIELWFNEYVEPTINKIYLMLKNNSYYAVNIANFNLNNKQVKYVDRWIKLSLKRGFIFDKKIEMKIQTRRGTGHKINGKDKNKKEGIYIFKK